MPFNIYCDNKGCMKEQVPLLDENKNEVICSECNKPIKAITEFAKRQMKSLGQVMKKKSNSAFSVKCKNCKVEDTPSIQDDELVCSACKSKLDLSKPFEQLVKTKLKRS